jgi:hypothetical protein
VEKFIKETAEDFGERPYTAVFPGRITIAQEALEQVKTALIFLEAQE